MDIIALARWQFAILTIYHFFFVPITLGLSTLLAIWETKYVTTGDETYKRMVKFWGKLFLINFAIGVVTGIVQEFQFGMNWSEYSRFMGDIFGAPLAIEALLAFYLESTFIAIWIFGWDKLSKPAHAAVMWLVAIGSNISAFWILVANSFMQNPVGYAIEDGRAVMTDFFALINNPNVWYQFPHVLTAGIATAGFVVMALSAWHLLQGKTENQDFFNRSFQWGAVYGLIGALLVGVIGHFQGQFLVEHQPMKMAVAEAHFNTEDPASLSLFTIGNWEQTEEVFSIRIPALLSFMTYNQPYGEIKGINQLQAEFEQIYGPGDYVPPVFLNYWAFRVMIGAGGLMVLMASLGILWRKKLETRTLYLKAMILAGFLPTIAITMGWILAETGRWPWIVYGLQKIEDAVSPNVPAWNIWFSMVSLSLLYAVIMVIGAKLALKYGTGDPAPADALTLSGDPASADTLTL
jgi:cytochrome d ubiquinol oxidase subunit I